MSESDSSSDDESKKFWSSDLDRYHLGDYSFAAIKGNSIMEDYSEVVVDKEFAFIGVYDGHGGHQTSEFLSEEMFKNLLSCINKHLTLSEQVLKEAFQISETNWVARIVKQCEGREFLSASGSYSGSSCLIGVIYRKKLYIANVGETRAVMVERTNSGNVTVEQLTRDDNVKYADVRAEVQALHPDDPNFVVEDAKTKGVYLIKGKTELSKSIGDVHLKYTECSIMGKKMYGLHNNPLVTSVPSLVELSLKPFKGEKFVIFASHGFWKLMNMEEASRIVVGLPWKGIAAILIKEALDRAATKTEKSFENVLSTKDRSGKKLYHDDITVVVLFFHSSLAIVDIQEQVTVKIGGSKTSKFFGEKLAVGR